MVRIEAGRFARHPAFVVGVLLMLAVSAWAHLWADSFVLDGQKYSLALLSGPIVPAFFVGLPSVLVAARLVRSTDAAAEVMGTAPGSEARRTLAVAGACVVPFLAGLAWILFGLVLIQVQPMHPAELWLPNVNDLWVWSVLVALSPVACLGGGLVGVLVGRWLRFPGAAAVAVVALVGLSMAGLPMANDPDLDRWRSWVPWSMWHSGSPTPDDFGQVPAGTSVLYGGNPATYVLYLLVLCALATVAAVWHDRTVRTPMLRLLAWGLVVLAVGCYLLTALTGFDLIVSDAYPKEAFQ